MAGHGLDGQRLEANRPRLSVAVIVRDDAIGLAATLASVAGLAHETVVLDTGSHDGTQAVAREHGARLVERPWDDDFSAARNACYEHCTGDWVLWLDAGESIAKESVAVVRALITKPENCTSAFRAIVRVPPPSLDAQAEQIAAVRLVPRLTSLHFTGRVRESLAASLASAGLSIADSSIVLERGWREHDVERKHLKARRDLRLAQRDLAERKNGAAALLAKAEASSVLRRHADAIDLLRLAITAAERGSAMQLAAYGALLAALDQIESQDVDTLQVRVAVGLEALDLFPLDAQLLLAMGGYLQAQGQIELAARSFRVAWEHGTITPDVWHIADARSMAASCLAIALQMLGRDDEAIDVLKTALRSTNDEARLRRRLLELHVRAGRREMALDEVAKVCPAAEHAQMRAAVRGACLAAAGNWIGALPHLETAYRQGCRDLLLRRAYLNALLATGQKAAAIRIADAWLTAEPNHAEAIRFRAMARGDAMPAKPTPTPQKPGVERAKPAAPYSARQVVRVDGAVAAAHAGVPDPLAPLAGPIVSRPNATT
jgi:tetratricopeptide (TPR) repeat protein/predicted lipoprotein with Yx(FWY)xxD motif